MFTAMLHGRYPEQAVIPTKTEFHAIFFCAEFSQEAKNELDFFKHSEQ